MHRGIEADVSWSLDRSASASLGSWFLALVVSCAGCLGGGLVFRPASGGGTEEMKLKTTILVCVLVFPLVSGVCYAMSASGRGDSTMEATALSSFQPD